MTRIMLNKEKGGSQSGEPPSFCIKLKSQGAESPYGIQLFRDECGQTYGRTRFLPDFGQKNSGRFRGGADTKNPEKARK